MTNKELDKYILEYIDGSEDAFEVLYQETYLHVLNKILKHKKVIKSLEELMLKIENYIFFYNNRQPLTPRLSFF